MTMTLESLGFTKEELQERVIERLCAQVMESVQFNEDGEEVPRASAFARKLDERIKEHIDAAVGALAEKHVLPSVSAYIETLSLQETNKWGEAVKAPMTFVEYLVARAENYLTEKVDYNGKTKDEERGYSWSGTQTRIVHLVHKHLHYSIESAMKKALETANGRIVGGIEEAVKIKLAEVLKALTVEVKTGR